MKKGAEFWGAVIKCKSVEELSDVIKKPQTNADRIRAMSDRELAEYLSTMQAHAYYHGMYHGKISDETEWLDWLQQEATE